MLQRICILSVLIISIGLVPIIAHSSEKSNAKVLVGADQVLDKPYINYLIGKRVGLVANAASVNSFGKHTIDIIRSNPKIHLLALFSPEHGLRGLKDHSVDDGHDPKTGLPVYSLYGPRKVPTKEQFNDIDIIVLDLQDVGLRYYTYATTMALIMKQAKKYHKQVMVLDRVDPLGGHIVSGATLEKQLTGGFAAYYPIPTRHGLTMGELARYFNKYFHIGSDLVVVPLKNWHRRMLFPQTGLQWRSPSPALPSFEQTYLYSVFGSLEALKLSVGRSKTNREAFRVYGAPWISTSQASKLVEKLNALKLAGLNFRLTSWVPNRAKYKGSQCHGFRVAITEPNNINSFYSLLEVLKVMNQELGQQLGLKQIRGMLGAGWLIKDIEENVPTQKMISRTKQENQGFVNNRKSILLYV